MFQGLCSKVQGSQTLALKVLALQFLPRAWLGAAQVIGFGSSLP